ncbi:MAG: transcription elongation factor GreA [Deltaproteobacteria bacterium]|jgi:transcription elongation factor GreA|nr:transcription elongation factor GreA [Deltaproteobacteria bacterium]
MERAPMTLEGYNALQDELKRLKGEERGKIIRAIEEARAHGDLSENAEYSAAKEAQSILEGRIRYIEELLSLAEIVDVSKLSGKKVVFGATVTLSDVDSGEERIVRIIGEEEAVIEKGYISYKSPLARALIGKNVDDVAKVKLPSGEKEYEIIEVRF